MKDEFKDQRGGNARSPLKIPVAGWKDIAIRIKQQVEADNIGIVSAGVSFYALLAIFPAMTAIIALYGMLFRRSDVQEHLSFFFDFLPGEASVMLQDQLLEISGTEEKALTLGAIAAVLLAIWSANKGVRALISALNIVYNEKETRGLIKINAVSLCITLSGVVFMILAATTVMVVPTALGLLTFLDDSMRYLALLRWPIIALVMTCGLSVLYRFAPNRRNARWQWVSVGSLVSTALWIIGSGLFSLYVTNFGSYNETYGSLGAVIILLMWFFVSTWIVLFGAEINSEIEHQTARDTTVGKPKPMGERGAVMADTVGERFGETSDKS